MVTIGIMQPYIFPYLGYFQLLKAVDVFVSHDDVQYIKGGWINRNRILFKDVSQYITFPIKKEPFNTAINRHYFAGSILLKKKKKILGSVRQAYSKAPFFNDIYFFLEDIISTKEKNIACFAEHTQLEILKYLNIEVTYKRSSELDLDTSLKGQDRVIEIVKRFKGKRYINPIGGLDLYSSEKFNKNGIELRFLNSIVKPYPQFSNDFVPNLSIIDVLMFNSIEKTKKILNHYELICEKPEHPHV
jgi:hypothetical protein